MLLREPVAPERESVRELGDATWVMVGGLAAALQQAGIVSLLLDRAPRPRCIFAAGVSVANAVLAAGGDHGHFERGWEQLRARRFVVTAALRGYRLLAAGDGLLEELAGKLSELGLAMSNGRAIEETPVHVATDDGFGVLPAEHRTTEWRAAVKATLRHGEASAPLVANALREAASEAPRVLVLGTDRTLQAHPDVESACRAADARGVRVEFLTASTDALPSLVQYALPGSGAAERLVMSGRVAAEAWLDAGIARASTDGVRAAATPEAPAQAPGGGGVGAAGDDESLARGAWRSEASDSSSWPK